MNTSASHSEQLDQVIDVLLAIRDGLRAEPPTEDVLELLVPIVDEDLGIPMLLSDILRASARAIAADVEPYSSEVSSVVADLREAAGEIMRWHCLHWAVRDLDRATAATSEVVS
ncbi:hypothetical protein [Streptomyces antarcticus]|uniref:hypothetical protein n=1 Tax=Streptomyces antarcticus TaxID=2996458 RepID=UPI002271DE97|nr:MULTISPECIES: hypothetical protein [unclassified Streptomyces]MCY0942331.1 hypothetical protein [Streptomyces sp. H34-AA3]MCZ4080672.1 hypothetical protein [Streptomyces sp. H34-S5]